MWECDTRAVTAVPVSLDAVRLAFDRRDWSVAFDGFRAADDREPLGATDLESFAAAAGRVGSGDWNRLLERAHDEYDRRRDCRGAARMALELARNHVLLGERNVGVGWWLRAGRLLEDQGECPERGLWLWMESRALMAEGELERGEALARDVMEIGRRTGDRDVEAFGLHDQGHYRLVAGDVQTALALLDEATALAVGGSLTPATAGAVLCGMIWACRNLGDWRRAAEWTDASVRYCDRETGYYYPGLCRVHRAEVVRVRGDYDDAERDIMSACAQLLAQNRSSAGWAYQELGEVRLRRGDLDGAAEAFRRASELGVEPQPGLARLILARGDATGALRSLQRTIAEARSLGDIENRPYVLPALVSIAIAAGDLTVTRRALDELESLGAIIESTAHQAALQTARGETALAEDRAGSAVTHLRGAIRGWCEVEAPYEAAQARLVLARAYESEAEPGAARLERETALATFDRLGARHDAERVRSDLEPPDQERATRTFMFTDIVDSTRVIEAIGDEAWNDLLAWHDRTLRGCFDRHSGEEIKHEGDGFFVAFASPKHGVDCAIEIQRVLVEHRRQHGFALRVRIGVHATEATRYGNDYIGRGVHETSRITAAAGPAEILVSEHTLEGLSVTIAELRSLDLKGLTAPVAATVVDWTTDQPRTP